MTKLLDHVRFSGRSQTELAPRRESARFVPSEVRVSSARPADPALDADEHALIERIFAQGGLAIADFRTAPLKRRLPAVLRAVRASDARAALAAVQNSPLLAAKALSTVVIGHTLGFRDVPVFESLRNQVIPQLPARPRVWSLGCSRGLELLSVALLLDEAGRIPELLRGSDCRAPRPWLDANLARDFSESIPPSLPGLARRATRGWVTDQIERIEWRAENILHAIEPGEFDLILCRNVSIYFEPQASQRLWELVASALPAGGWLVTGKAEQPAPRGRLRRVAPCIYQCEEDLR